jgi:hypothetical protein
VAVSRAINARRFSAVMRDLARVPSRVSRAVADDISDEIQRSMDASVDPYGRPWRLTRSGGRTQLLDTGGGRASIIVRPTAGAGIRITIGELHMIYHQFGGRSHLKGPSGTSADRRKHRDFGRDRDRSKGRMQPPQRMYIPFEVLPRTWGEIVLGHIEAMGQRVIDG